MDSLLANYASSDEEEDHQQPPIQATPPKTTPSSSLFSSLPQPKSSPSPLFQSLPPPKSSSSFSSSPSSLFQSLPKPKQSSINPSPTIEDADEAAPTSSKSSDSDSLFSSLPKPKSQIQQPQEQPKKVVQFKPPFIHLPKPAHLDDDDDEEDDEEEERKRRRKLQTSTQTPSVKSFLSSIPAPRNATTLGVQSSSGLGRRSIIETDAAPEPASNPSAGEGYAPVDQNAEDYSGYQYYGTDQHAGSGSGYMMGDANYGSFGSGIDQSMGFQHETGVAGAVGYGDGDGDGDGAYASYSASGDYGQYANNWVDRSAMAPEASGVGESAVRIPGKRGRNEIPAEIIEVKQDELIKNRPREDQVKVTGIAFGPAYQPVSAKGKPTKLHKRKHQIGSLYFDMKQNEMKLAERRAKGMLTKAETQAKYGW